jgi:DHA3 family macrolide efflux protein-like MFS transporter
MPAWFLGGLESSISLGAIVGALSIGFMQKRLRAHFLIILAIAMIGIGVAVLPWVPTVMLPLSILFWIGLGGTWANIPIGTQFALSVPDHYRSRIGSIMNFMCTGISPLGVATAGILISQIGLSTSMMIMGGVVLLLTPLILFIPKFKDFLSSTSQDAGTFFERHYPGVIELRIDS